MQNQEPILDKKKETVFTVVNSVKLDPKNPVPIQYNGDSFYVVSGKKYLPFLDKKDNLANLLLEARLTSTTQNSCIESIAQSVIGKGMKITDVENPETEFVNWLKCVNDKNKSIDYVLQAALEGERTFGNQFVEVTKFELNGKKFIKLHLHSFLFTRLSEPTEDEDEPTGVIISKLFAKKGYKKIDLEKSRVVPLWRDNIIEKDKCWKKNDDGSYSTMLHLKNEVSGIEHYGLPASISSLRNQVNEARGEQYNLDNFENNMILGGLLILKSAMTQEEAQETAKNILLSHVGEGKTGRIAVISSEEGLKDVDFKPFETQKDGSFIELDKLTTSKIITANGWAKEFTVAESAGLGKGGAYLRSLWDLKEAMLLNPLRQKIIDELVIPIVKIYADFHDKKELLKYTFSFVSSMPFSFMGEVDPETFMKVKEARTLAGLDADEANGEKYLSEMKSKTKDVQTKPPTT